jgi:hypothetical protein
MYVIAVMCCMPDREGGLGGGEEKQLTICDVVEPEDLEIHLDTSQRNHEGMCSSGC